MEKVLEISLLLDFYGQLLTPRQLEILDLHYNNDYSLGEIAQEFNISRQGVHDNIKRGKAALNEFEEKLKLVKKFMRQKKKAEEILHYIDSINTDGMSESDRINLKKVKDGISDIIENI
ncbi:MAG: putative DNA-binding protein [Clostridiales bacterium]|jgi:predicted DNA-binding protein YlxM (UPF0122 family)|nr:putative DNA-binding protein [Eubacteriales bacterium]MDH7565093.1 putative DNA-binding protein [Clostridiales bacterium]